MDISPCLQSPTQANRTKARERASVQGIAKQDVAKAYTKTCHFAWELQYLSQLLSRRPSAKKVSQRFLRFPVHQRQRSSTQSNRVLQSCCLRTKFEFLCQPKTAKSSSYVCVFTTVSERLRKTRCPATQPAKSKIKQLCLRALSRFWRKSCLKPPAQVFLLPPRRMRRPAEQRPRL